MVNDISLEQEFRFCLTQKDWLRLANLLNIKELTLQSDETWRVSSDPLKIARIRSSGNSSPIFMYKTVLSKTDSNEEYLDFESEEQARSYFNSSYEKDLDIRKMRGTRLHQGLSITLDVVFDVGYCFEIEGSNSRIKNQLLNLLCIDPNQTIEGYGFYLRAGITPDPISLSFPSVTTLPIRL